MHDESSWKYGPLHIFHPWIDVCCLYQLLYLLDDPHPRLYLLHCCCSGSFRLLRLTLFWGTYRKYCNVQQHLLKVPHCRFT